MNSTLAYCPASDTAEICACPTKLSMMTSAEVTAALSRFCRTMGQVSLAMRPYRALFVSEGSLLSDMVSSLFVRCAAERDHSNRTAPLDSMTPRYQRAESLGMRRSVA